MKPEIEELLTKSQILCQNGKILSNDRFAFFQRVRDFFNCFLYDLLVLQKLLRRVIGERVHMLHFKFEGVRPILARCVQFQIVASNFGQLRPISDSCVQLRTVASNFGQFRPTLDSCVQFRSVASDFGQLSLILDDSVKFHSVRVPL